MFSAINKLNTSEFLKNLKIPQLVKKFPTIYETRKLTLLEEEGRVRVFENWILKRIFEPTKAEILRGAGESFVIRIFVMYILHKISLW
jgi:hypothetical protein